MFLAETRPAWGEDGGSGRYAEMVDADNMTHASQRTTYVVRLFIGSAIGGAVWICGGGFSPVLGRESNEGGRPLLSPSLSEPL